MKQIFSSILFCSLLVCTPDPSVAQTGGKTFGNEVTFVEPPNLRLVSRDTINGRPAFDYFILVKAKLNGIYDISGGLQDYETFNVGQIDVWGTDDTQRFWMDMHQTQLRFRGQRETEMGTFIGYLEGDFWGGASISASVTHGSTSSSFISARTGASSATKISGRTSWTGMGLPRACGTGPPS